VGSSLAIFSMRTSYSLMRSLNDFNFFAKQHRFGQVTRLLLITSDILEFLIVIFSPTGAGRAS
jgi:hypothetical protein